MHGKKTESRQGREREIGVCARESIVATLRARRVGGGEGGKERRGAAVKRGSYVCPAEYLLTFLLPYSSHSVGVVRSR